MTITIDISKTRNPDMLEIQIEDGDGNWRRQECTKDSVVIRAEEMSNAAIRKVVERLRKDK